MPSYKRFAVVRIGQRGGEALEFTGQRITFDISKSNASTPNTGSISIFNLAAFSRDKIRTIGDAVDLEAGHEDDDYGGRLVISADVTDIVNEKSGNDIITTVKIGDGVEFLKSIKDAYSFKAGTSVKDIITKIAGSSGITLKSLESLIDANYPNGFSEMGPLREILDKLAGKLNATWSFQNNELQILPKLAHNGSTVFRIASDTGMIQSPERDVDTSQITPAPQSDGWKVSALMRPEIGPGDRVEIESSIVDVSGIYHVKEIRHVGDTFQGPWTSTLRVRESSN